MPQSFIVKCQISFNLFSHSLIQQTFIALSIKWLELQSYKYFSEAEYFHWLTQKSKNIIYLPFSPFSKNFQSLSALFSGVFSSSGSSSNSSSGISLKIACWRKTKTNKRYRFVKDREAFCYDILPPICI